VNLPERVGVTANLNLDYRAPAKADQFVVMKTKVLRRDGRKIWVEGRIETMQGTTLVNAKYVFLFYCSPSLLLSKLHIQSPIYPTQVCAIPQ
jgi:acyl-CoA thioesterase FadM